MCEACIFVLFTADRDDRSSSGSARGVTGQIVSLWTGVVATFEEGTVGEDDWAWLRR